MFKTIFAALVAVALTTAADAKVFKLGSPVVASIDLPADWKPETIDNGVEAVSPDEEIYVAVEVASVNSAEKAITESFEFLLKQGITVDEKSVKQTDGKINGMPVFDISAKGKDEDGKAAEISVAVVVVNQTTMLVLTYWGTPEGEKKHAAALDKIAKSLKPE